MPVGYNRYVPGNNVLHMYETFPAAYYLLTLYAKNK